jgi:hypothetical protein
MVPISLYAANWKSFVVITHALIAAPPDERTLQSKPCVLDA